MLSVVGFVFLKENGDVSVDQKYIICKFLDACYRRKLPPQDHPDSTWALGNCEAIKWEGVLKFFVITSVFLYVGDKFLPLSLSPTYISVRSKLETPCPTVFNHDYIFRRSPCEHVMNPNIYIYIYLYSSLRSNILLRVAKPIHAIA